MDDFYARWFTHTQPPPPTPEQAWQQNTDFLRSIAKGDWAEELAERFDVPEVTEAEEHFKTRNSDTPLTRRLGGFRGHIRFWAFAQGDFRRTAGRNLFKAHL